MDSSPCRVALRKDNLLETAPPTSLQARIITAAGEAVPHAIVEATPQNPLETPQISMADTKGVVTLLDLPPGALQLSASADGFATGVISVPDDGRTGIVMMLSRAGNKP